MRISRKRLNQISRGTVLVATLSACQDEPVSPALTTPPRQSVTQTVASDSIPNAYIVLLHDSVRADARTKADELIAGVRSGRRNHTYSDLFKGFSVVDLSAAAAAALARNPAVRLIEPDRILYPADAQLLPLDGTSYQLSTYWNLDRIDEFGVPVFDGVYQYDYTGATTHIYIVDSGVRGTHQQFAGRMGNGACKISWSFGCSPTIDQLGHGTGVASLAAGSTYGVAKQAIVHPVRIDDGTDGASCSDIVDGLNWVKANHIWPAVANLSYGGIPNCFSVRDALDGLVNNNVVAVKSAGNNNQDAFQDRANRSAGSIIVGATDQFDNRAYFCCGEASNWGPTLSLFAPGNVMRAARAGSDVDSTLFSGTSGAAPLVAGVAALVRQHYPTFTVASVKNAIVNGASTGVVGNAPTSPNKLLFSRIP